METLIAAVLVAGVMAAAWWRSASRSAGSAVGFGSPQGDEQQGDLFVLQPADVAHPKTDRPPTFVSVARITAVVVVSTLVMVAVTWLLGLAVKAALDGYFSPG